MGDRILLSELSAQVAPNLVSWRNWADASFITLPIVYPSGSFVTVRLTYAPEGVRVSDSGFAFREAESFGAGRSFPNTARAVAEGFDISVGKRAIYIDVPFEHVERAIFDVSAASHAVAERIVSKVAHDGEAAISEILHVKLDRIFSKAVEHEGKISGASSTEWEVSAVAKVDGRMVVYQAVTNYPVAVFRTSAAFHDIAALDNPPSLISVISSKSEMGKNYSILAQAGRVIEISQDDKIFLKAAA